MSSVLVGGATARRPPRPAASAAATWDCSGPTLALDPLICALSESASALARFSCRVTSSYSLPSWSMVPSSDVDLRRALREPDVVGVGPHHRRVDEVDDAEVGGLRGVALLDLLDVAEDLALALGDGEQFAGLDQRVDLLERLGQPGQAAGFVEHELADELFQSANAFQ